MSSVAPPKTRPACSVLTALLALALGAAAAAAAVRSVSGAAPGPGAPSVSGAAAAGPRGPRDAGASGEDGGALDAAGTRALLLDAADDPGLDPRQRDVLRRLAAGAAAGTTGGDRPEPRRPEGAGADFEFPGGGTREFDGGWEELAPPSRAGHSAVYDSLRDRLVVFGGLDARDSRTVWILDLAAGTPFWSRLEPAGEPPPARHGHVAAYDAARDRVLVFGGYGDGYRNDLWALDLSAGPVWTQLDPTGAPPSGRYNAAAVLDPVRDRLLLVGGFDGLLRNDVWELSLGAGPAWSQLSPGGAPPAARWGHSAIYDPAGDRVVVFGGWNGAYRNDTWSLSLNGGPAWSQLAPAGGPPPAREWHAAIREGGRMLVYGGYGGGEGVRADVWSLSLGGGPAWTQLAPGGGAPEGRYRHGLALDTRRGRAVAYGGYPEGEGTVSWALDLAEPVAWIRFDAGSTRPGPRWRHAAVWDPTRDRLLVLGGDDGAPTAEVWSWRADAVPEWELLSPAGTAPTPRWGHAAVYDPARDRVIVTGGDDGLPECDAWALDLDPAPAWNRLNPAGTAPSARWGHTAVYDPEGDRILLFGGWAGGLKNDLWQLALSGSPAWSPVSAAGGPPAARHLHAAVYDPPGRRMLIQGGFVASGATADLWSLSLDPPTNWAALAPAGTPPSPRYRHAAAYDPVRRRMAIFGGYDEGSFGDAAVLSLGEAPAWAALAPLGESPVPRNGHTAVYDPGRNRLVVFGGAEETWPVCADAWSLAWPAAGPGTLAGSVTDHEPTPVENAVVSAWADTGLVAAAASGSGGAYSLSLPEGTYRVTAEADGYLLAESLGVAVLADLPAALDLVVGRLLAGDAAHLPDHTTAWDFEADHSVSWTSEPAAVDSVSLEWSADGGASWNALARGLPASGSHLWTAAEVPDSSTTAARLRYTAVDSGGETLGVVVGPPFALRRSTDLLLRVERHVFDWPAGPPETARYRISFDLDTLSACGAGAAAVYETGDTAPYFQVPEADWSGMAVGRWLLAVDALDGTDQVLETRDTTVVLLDLDALAGAAPEDPPVVLLHDWGGSASDWALPGNDLVSILGGAGFEVWSVGYPAAGDIALSAGGLARALDRILARKDPGTRARVVAHGLGGLVARAYVQGLASAPDGSPVAYAGNLGALVTLGTPHLGAPWEAARALFAAAGPLCRARPGDAVAQADGDRYRVDQLRSPFLQTLNDLGGHPLDGAANYLFAGGCLPSTPGLAWVTPAVEASLLFRMSGGNDGLVPLRSALAEGIGAPASCVVRAVDHAALAVFTVGSADALELAAFLADGTPPPCAAPPLRQLAGRVERMGEVPGSPLRAARGAIARAYDAGSGFAGAGGRDGAAPVAVAVADSSGHFVLPFLPERDLSISVSAEGGRDLAFDLRLDGEASGWLWDLVLEADTTAAGPRNPWILADGGAPAAPDSAVVLSLGAAGAVEMLLSDRPDFAGASWQPLVSPVAWDLPDRPGAHAVFARFRDGEGAECAAVYAGTRLTGPGTGEVEIAADSTGAAVYLDGVRLAGATTALVTGLDPGDHTVSVAFDRFRPAPPADTVTVTAGGQAASAFALAARQPPVAFDPISPADGAFDTTGTPRFVWGASSDPDPFSAVGYRLEVSRDTLFSTFDLEVGGLSDTSYTPAVALADSSVYAWRARARSVFRLETASDGGFRRLVIDRTSPSALVLEPNGGESWTPGDSATIRWRAEDWSGLDSVRISLSLDDGATWTLILEPAVDDTLLRWAVPDSFLVAHPDCRVRVEAWDLPGRRGADLSDGTFTIPSPGTVDAPPSGSAARLFLEPVHPNPSAGSGVLVFGLPAPGRVRLSLFDVAGREAARLHDGVLPAGVHRLFLSGAAGPRLAAGVYHLRLEVGRERRVQRLVIVR